MRKQVLWNFLYYILKARFYDNKFYLQHNGAQEPLSLQDLLYQNLWLSLLCPARNENLQGLSSSWFSQRAFVHTGP